MNRSTLLCKKTDTFLPAGKNESAADQSQLAPAGNRLRRDAKHAAQVLDGMHGLRKIGRANIRGVRDVFDE